MYFFELSAQKDSIQYTLDFKFEEGIYINYLDFRMNRPISKALLVSKENKDQLDFIGKTIENSEFIIFSFGGKDFKVKTDSIWGFSQNNSVYINYDKKMFRIPVFGNISQLIVTEEISNQYRGTTSSAFYYNYGMTIGGSPTNVREMKQMMLDFYTGKLIEFELENVEEILKRDQKIHQEFMSLSRNKRRQKMSSFLRNFNLVHPIYFPANLSAK
jgi:hypothetical protein